MDEMTFEELDDTDLKEIVKYMESPENREYFKYYSSQLTFNSYPPNQHSLHITFRGDRCNTNNRRVLGGLMNLLIEAAKVPYFKESDSGCTDLSHVHTP